ncbi:LTA synthase family protein [Neobittarella massiliensis]|uniref:LTA synthase family protein n=1 Tax=Neobittarella massiliensis (ex Bilen et al. 2018) TaxID=2041842 RepID=UPI000CF64440|nr:LTA synthase family protein [Neobittarella massiliensis]
MSFRFNKKRSLYALPITAALLAGLLLLGNVFVNENGNLRRMHYIACFIFAVLIGLALTFDWNIGEKLQKHVVHSCLFLSPLAAFCIIEIFNDNNPFEIKPGAIVLNYLWFLVLHLLVYALSNRMRVTVITVNALAFILGAAYQAVLTFRGTPVLPGDLLVLGIAMDVAGGYSYKVTDLLVLAVLVLAFVIILAIKLCQVKVREKLWHRAALALAAPLFALLFYATPLMDWMGLSFTLWQPAKQYQRNGVVTYFAMNLKYISIKEPEEYSAEKAQQIIKNGDYKSDTAKASKKSPNVIAIMNETFSDLGVVGDLQTDQDYMPFVRGLKENTVKGTLYVPVKGAGTCNTEFEFITGNSMSHLSPGVYPYQQYIEEPTDSLASILKEQGYTTSAIHPYYPEGWNRENVYPLLGFDRFYSIYDFEKQETPPEKIRDYISDRESYRKIIDLYESRMPGEKMFVFNVTMQNHGGYNYSDYEPTVHITKPEGTYDDAEQYLSLIKESDTAFQELVNYFSQQEEPTIILMFGDHQPKLQTKFFEKLMGKSLDDLTIEETQKLYEVPFVIWANYDIEEQEIARISTNYLSSLLLKTAGLKLPAYNKFLLNLYKEFPVIDSTGIIDKNGQYYAVGDPGTDNPLLDEYSILQYNNLFDPKNKLKGVFALKVKKEDPPADLGSSSTQSSDAGPTSPDTQQTSSENTAAAA